MATSQNRRNARSRTQFVAKPKGVITTPRKRCSVQVGVPGSPIGAPCGDPVKKAGRCAEHFADWKHAKESRRGVPATLTHGNPLKNHGTGTSASALANMAARANRLTRGRKVA